MNPRLAALTGALLFSTGGAAIKATTLSSWQVAGLRSLIAALTIALLLPAARRHWTWRAGLVAISYALCLSSFVLATKNTTSANAIFLQGTAPLYLVFLGPWLLHEKVRNSDWWTLSLVIVGMVLVFWDTGNAQLLSPNPILGNIYGAISGLTWAGTVCGLRWLSKRGEGNTMAPVLIGNLLAVVLCLPGMFPLEDITSTDLFSLVYMGVFQIGLAYWFLTAAMTKLSAFEASLLIMIEPALNPLWVWMMHGEKPTPTALAGGTLIIGSALMKSWQDRKNVLF